MNEERKKLGLYIHIPFCLSKCYYCDFCSFPDKNGEIKEQYVGELCRRLKNADGVTDRVVDTIYFGGGTPTLLSVGQFSRIIDVISGSFSLAESVEMTAECNPATADREYLSELCGLGVNRLSMGLQSTHDNELAALGRIHTYADLLKTYSEARSVGFSNISLDLMYGIPEQTSESFALSLDRVTSLDPEHISSYGLKIEEGTNFYQRADRLIRPDEDTECEMYLEMSRRLGSGGYFKYEISNFAKPGYESKHNMKYWTGEEYLGFGLAAHSFFGGERFGNSRDMSAFLRGESIECERVCLSDNDRFCEYVMLSLRLAGGIDISEFERLWGRDLYECFGSVKKWCDCGYMCEKEGRIFFTDKGFLVSNTILAEMLDFD